MQNHKTLDIDHESTGDKTDKEHQTKSFIKRAPRRTLFFKILSETTDEDSEVLNHWPSKESRKTMKASPVTIISNGSSGDEIITPKKRRLNKRMERSPSIVCDDSDEQAANDLREDLEDLRGSGKFAPLSLHSILCQQNVLTQKTRGAQKPHKRQDNHTKENCQAKTYRNA